MTDSSCDLPAELAEKMALTVLPLYVDVDGQKYVNYLDEREISFKEIYAKLRTKCPAKTSAVNFNDFMGAMEALLREGKDILYIGFSSGLSSTYDAGASAAQELAERYPERKIYAVDSLCASLGQGLLVYLAWKQKEQGRTIEEVRDYVENNKLRLCHWFTVENLKYLRRGGRISATSAVVGTLLDIKPVLHVDDAGKLIAMTKVRGVRASVKEMFERMKQTAVRDPESPVFINHADILDRANELADMIRAEFGTKEIYIDSLDLVIGAHSGPGTLALFFLGDHR
jgi:DegV family protein with EDD domain